jgi:TRAP-type C4-dicarboxylate transport system substrate-binding protein
VISINEDAWQALAPDLKDAVGKAAATTEERQWREIVARIAANGGRLRSNGVTVSADLAPDFVQALRTAGDAAVDAWIGKAGSDGREALDRYRSRLP